MIPQLRRSSDTLENKTINFYGPNGELWWSGRFFGLQSSLNNSDRLAGTAPSAELVKGAFNSTALVAEHLAVTDKPYSIGPYTFSHDPATGTATVSYNGEPMLSGVPGSPPIAGECFDSRKAGQLLQISGLLQQQLALAEQDTEQTIPTPQMDQLAL